MVMNIPHPIIYYNTDFHWSHFMDIIIHEFEDWQLVRLFNCTNIHRYLIFKGYSMC